MDDSPLPKIFGNARGPYENHPTQRGAMSTLQGVPFKLLAAVAMLYSRTLG